MKGLLYVVFLFLSLPNLIAGLALLVVRHTFATFQPLEIITSFLFQMVWGLPLAVALFIVLLVLGMFARTRPHTALLSLVLNIAALGLVLYRIGLPSDFDGAFFFLPILVASIGFGWMAWYVFAAGKAKMAETTDD